MVCVGSALACLATIYYRFTARVVLHADGLELRSLFQRQWLYRGEIAGWSRKLPHGDASWNRPDCRVPPIFWGLRLRLAGPRN